MTASGDAFAAALLDWFAVHGRRDLPWQAVRDPYRIWVSEIMLQQTQVATVIPYFERFIASFPTVAALAAAPLDAVLAHWSGLGYYARARNLHRAAGIVVAVHRGELPRDHAVLCELPGIGRSTAAAILALAWNEPHTILDGNVKRVLARFHGVRGFSGQSAVLARLWQLAEAHTPADRAAEYTQAIMDLGATVCVRGRALCAQCPVAADCTALADGSVAELPEPRPKRVKPQRARTVLLLRTAANELLLERRPPSGIWGGLLSLPELPDDVAPAAWCRDILGIDAIETERLAPVRHGFTHFDLELRPVVMQVGQSSAADGEIGSGAAIETIVRADSSAGDGAGDTERPNAPAAARVADDARWLWYKGSAPLPGGVAAPIGRLIGQLADVAARATDSSHDREATQ